MINLRLCVCVPHRWVCRHLKFMDYLRKYFISITHGDRNKVFTSGYERMIVCVSSASLDRSSFITRSFWVIPIKPPGMYRKQRNEQITNWKSLARKTGKQGWQNLVVLIYRTIEVYGSHLWICCPMSHGHIYIFGFITRNYHKLVINQLLGIGHCWLSQQSRE